MGDTDLMDVCKAGAPSTVCLCCKIARFILSVTRKGSFFPLCVNWEDLVGGHHNSLIESISVTMSLEDETG